MGRYSFQVHNQSSNLCGTLWEYLNYQYLPKIISRGKTERKKKLNTYANLFSLEYKFLGLYL